MKKSIILISLAAAVIFSACQKSQNPAKGLEFTALVEQPSVGESTKTYLDGTQVKWSANDAISVFTDASENIKLTLSGGEGTPIARFTTTATATGNPTCSLYPYKAESTASNKTVSFTLPAHQAHKGNNISDGANYTIANITGKNLEFKNVCGILRLKLAGPANIDKIELKGNSGEKLNGLFSVDASSDNPAATCVSTSEESEQIITLDCNGANLITDSLYYFMVPVGAFSNGFSAKVYYTSFNGETGTAELSTSNDNTIERSMITNMPNQHIGPGIPSGYTAVKCIYCNSGSGYDGAYIKTGVLVKTDLITQMSFRYPAYSKTKSSRLFGARTTGGAYYVGTDSGRMDSTKFDYLWANNASYVVTSTFIDYDLHLLKFGKGEFILDGTLISSSSGSITNPAEMYILSVNEGGNAGYRGGAEVYSCYMYDDTSTLRYFVPAVKNLGEESEEVGLYDMVTSTFFASADAIHKFSYILY